MANQEVELKLLLPDATAHGLLRAALERLATPRLVEQVNYYLDTPRLDLRRQRVMVRVRVADDVTVTCKSKPQLVKGLMRTGEVERQLKGPPAEPWRQHPPARVQVAALGLEDWLLDGGPLHGLLAPDTWLHVVGTLANSRRVFTIDRSVLAGQGRGELKLELDHSRFGSGDERFELELEHEDAEELRPEVEAFLDALDIDSQPATESKYEQMLRLSAKAGPSLP